MKSKIPHSTYLLEEKILDELTKIRFISEELELLATEADSAVIKILRYLEMTRSRSSSPKEQ